MRRWWLITVYALAGFGLAVAMAWAGFSVAAQRLSTPADPVQPLGLSIPSVSSHPSHTPSPRPPASDNPSPTPQTITEAPATPTSGGTPSSVHTASPSAPPPSDDLTHSGGGGDD